MQKTYLILDKLRKTAHFFPFLYFRFVLDFVCTLFNTASSTAPQIPLCRRMLGSNQELSRLWHWQPNALTIWLDLIHNIHKGTTVSKNIFTNICCFVLRPVSCTSIITAAVFYRPFGFFELKLRLGPVK
jgi:hypothetical protein